MSETPPMVQLTSCKALNPGELPRKSSCCDLQEAFERILFLIYSLIMSTPFTTCDNAITTEETLAHFYMHYLGLVTVNWGFILVCQGICLKEGFLGEFSMCSRREGYNCVFGL